MADPAELIAKMVDAMNTADLNGTADYEVLAKAALAAIGPQAPTSAPTFDEKLEEHFTFAMETMPESAAAFVRMVKGEPSTDARATVEQMVSRFLSWPLPKDFHPDCGISFDGRKPDARGYPAAWPVGTNLFTYTQAKAMVGHMLDLPLYRVSIPTKLAPDQVPR